MTKLTDQHYLRTDQYRDDSKLDARVQLHARFSTNTYGLHRWIFDRLALPPATRILELGCGPGWLWRENRDRIPAGWRITLSDLSPGMVEQARQHLGSHAPAFRYGSIDAQAIPLATATLDAVIANHMLYHIPDRNRALAEIRRILRPGGRFYASTVGRGHMAELDELLHRFDPGAPRWDVPPTDPFLLENAAAQIAPWFQVVEVHRYEDGLVVTEVEPLVAYVASTITKSAFLRNRLDEFRALVRQEMAPQGAIHITKSTGLLAAVRDDG